MYKKWKKLKALQEGFRLFVGLTAATSEELSAQAETLNQLVSQFKLNV